MKEALDTINFTMEVPSTFIVRTSGLIALVVPNKMVANNSIAEKEAWSKK